MGEESKESRREDWDEREEKEEGEGRKKGNR